MRAGKEGGYEMKYTEVPLFKEGMPSWLYEMKEKDRLKIDFEVSMDGKTWGIRKTGRRAITMTDICKIILIRIQLFLLRFKK